MKSTDALRGATRDMRDKSVVTRAAVDHLQKIIAGIFREHDKSGCGSECDSVRMLTELFAAVTEEGRLWGEYIWLLLVLRRLGVGVPPEKTAKAQQMLVDLLQELAG